MAPTLPMYYTPSPRACNRNSLLSRPEKLITLSITFKEGDRTYVGVASDAGTQLIPCAARDLLTFGRFQRRVQDYLGVRVSHFSQSKPAFGDRAAAWKASVASATRRGGAR
jgi:hypothetical protein